jgi:hypothetical protein
MDDPLLMGRFECVGDLACDGHGFGEWDRSLCDAIVERGAFDQFHDQRAGAVKLLESEHLRDVRVIQRRSKRSVKLS